MCFIIKKKLCSPSSYNEDRPPPSEEEFMDSDEIDTYDRLIEQSGFAPALTTMQSSLLRNLGRYIVKFTDSAEQV